jgi:hypothetical protein
MDAFAAASRTRRDYGPRMAIFREMATRDSIDLQVEYARAMKFAAPSGTEYQTRGLSTDSSVDAGYAVYLSLGALRALEPDRQIQTVLIVGPGMDLAPRTGYVESSAPQSYQPFAVIDALIATGLSQRKTLRVTAADINPRVVDWLARTRNTRPTLTLVPGIQEKGEPGRVQLTEDYRDFFTTFGRAIGKEQPLPDTAGRRVAKAITLAAGVADIIDSVALDITIARLEARYALVIVTNVFPYLSDAELLLAVTNIFGMLSPGGILIHNEPRPALADALLALGMPLLQSRSAVVATVEASSPLYDSVWMHRAPLGGP